MEIPGPIAWQALHPFRALPPAPGWQLVEREGIVVCLHSMPVAQLVEPVDLDPAGVGGAVEIARAVVREHGRKVLVWIAGPDERWLGARLAELGLVNADTPGFESVENAMALVQPPRGEVPDGVEVREVETFEEFAASNQVVAEAFGVTAEMRDEFEAGMPARYEEYTTPGNPFRQWSASMDGRVVGTASGATCAAGVNLFGGSVLASARGRGIYRALTFARWEFAVAQGTPALTVQAGRMSMPIVERLGFEAVGTLDVYVDDFSESS